MVDRLYTYEPPAFRRLELITRKKDQRSDAQITSTQRLWESRVQIQGFQLI